MNFWRQAKDLVFTFRETEEELLIDDAYQSLITASNRVRALEDFVGFDLTEDAFYLYGTANPALSGRPGRSMAIAFRPFGRAFRERSRIRFGRILKPDAFTCGHAVTFGSPSSNHTVRSVMGYAEQDESGWTLEHTGLCDDIPLPFDLPVKFVLDKPNGGPDRGHYAEPRWELDANGVTFQPAMDMRDKRLLSDFLVLSCLPNLRCATTAEALEASRDLQHAERQGPGDTPASRARLAQLRHRSKAPLSKLLSVAGVHGPGTAAAQLLLDDREALRALLIALRKAGSPAYWQAIVPVSSVVFDQQVQRDRPAAVDTSRIDVFPIRLG